MQIGSYGQVFQLDVAAIIQHESGSSGRECARPFVGFHCQGMRIENFVIGIVYPGPLHSCTFNLYICFVPGIYQFFVVTGLYQNYGLFLTEIGNKVECSLYGVEITLSGCIYNQCVCRSGSGVFSFETPVMLFTDTVETVVG